MRGSDVLCDGKSQEGRKGVPAPKGNEEAKPGEVDDPAVDVDEVEHRDGTRLMVDRIHLRSPPEKRDVEHLARNPDTKTRAFSRSRTVVKTRMQGNLNDEPATASDQQTGASYEHSSG